MGKVPPNGFPTSLPSYGVIQKRTSFQEIKCCNSGNFTFLPEGLCAISCGDNLFKDSVLSFGVIMSRDQKWSEFLAAFIQVHQGSGKFRSVFLKYTKVFLKHELMVTFISATIDKTNCKPCRWASLKPWTQLLYQ